MARLLRVHFSSIGHPHARLAPLTLDFRSGDQGTGADSVIWLRNGGGKSSILNLFFSIFRTGRREFLGAAAEGKSRHLEDYVKDTDIAFIVSEWDTSPPSQARQLFDTPRHTRIIGQALAWRNHQRSKDVSRLRRLCFSLRSDLEIGWRHLPIQGIAEAPAASFDAFRDWLNEQKGRHPAAELVATEPGPPWRQHLESVGIDPELMRMQIEMNLREGAADEAFRFDSGREFVEFFLKLAMDLAAADQLSANLEAFREKLRRRPERRLERDFVDAVLAPLDHLAAAVQGHRSAEEELAAATRHAAGLVAALVSRVARLAEREQDRLRQADLHREELRRASNEADKQRRWAGGLDRHAVRLEVKECEEALAEASELLAAIDDELRALKAADVLAEVRRIEATIAEKQASLRRLHEELEPLRIDLQRAGDVLRAVLGRQLERVAEQVERSRDLAGSADERLKALREEKARLDREGGRLESEIRGLSESIERRDAAREQLVRDAVCESREQAQGAFSRWQARESDLTGAREELVMRRDTAESQQRDAQTRLKTATRQRAELSGEKRRVAEVVRRGRERRATLAVDPQLCEVEGADEVDLDSPGLEDRLRGAAHGEQRKLLGLRVDGAEDQRALAALADTGLLPSSRDADAVLQRLLHARVPAFAGMHYLEQTMPPPSRAALVVSAPARYAGVVVTTADGLEHAATLDLEALALRSPVQVTLATAQPSPEQHDAVVVAPDPALYDREAADRRRNELAARAERRDAQAHAFEARRSNFERAAAAVAGYRQEFGDGKLAALERHEQTVQGQLDAADAELAHLDSRLFELDAELAACKDLAAGYERELRVVHGALARLQAFIDGHERHLDGWRQRLDEARTTQLAGRQRAEQLGDDIRDAETRARDLRDEVRDLEHERDMLAKRRLAVMHHGVGALDPGDVTEDRATARYEGLRAIYEGKTSDNRLQIEIDLLAEQLAKSDEELRKCSAGIDPARLDALLDRLDRTGDATRLERERSAALERQSVAKVKLDKAKREEAKFATRARQNDDLPPDLPLPQDSGEARREAELCRERASHFDEAAARAKTNEDAQRQEADTLARRKDRHELWLGLLREVGGELPEAPPLVLPEADDGIQSLGERARERLKHVRERAATALAEVQRNADAVLQIANDPRFAELRSQGRDRLRADRVELIERSEEFSLEFVARLTVLEDELQKIEADRKILLRNLAGLGHDAAKLLQQAERASLLPDGLLEWAGKPYLRIAFQLPASDDERIARLEPWIDRLMSEAVLPDGLKLVQRAIVELVGPRGFEVTIFKPDAVLRGDRIPIEEMSTFSRGQQLTTAILLYCTLVQLRARRRGYTGRVRDAGVLILDNPIGTCSSVPLLDLQRRIAQEMRVQLVYTTGVGDLEALAVMPNIIRLRNSHRDRRSGDFHVVQDGMIDGVRVVKVAHEHRA